MEGLDFKDSAHGKYRGIYLENVHPIPLSKKDSQEFAYIISLFIPSFLLRGNPKQLT